VKEKPAAAADAEPEETEPAEAEPEAAEPGAAEPEEAEPEPTPARESGPEPPPAIAYAPGSEAAPAVADAADGGDPPAEDVEVSDLLLVVDMHDDVFVVDEHPRYHLADCRWLAGREAIPFPVDEARTDGFTPCGLCSPDRHLAQVARARKASAS
jgi:hypothetical protein